MLFLLALEHEDSSKPTQQNRGQTKPAAGLGVPLPQGKSWYVILFSRGESADVAVLDAVSGGPGSPSDMLSLMAVGTSVRRLGNLSIRGVDTAGYAFLVPPSVFQRIASA